MAPTNNSLLSLIEYHRKPSLLEYDLHKMKRFTQSYSKKKFAERLLARSEVDHLMENLLKNPNYDKELYDKLKQRARDIDEEDLKVQLELNKDFIATKEDRGSKIFLTLENAKKGYHEIHKLQKGPLITVTDPTLHTQVIHQNITTNVHEINDILVDTFQDIYNKQDDLKPSEEDIIDFLNCDNDTRPYEELKRRRDKVPKKLYKKMEGKLTDDELHYAIFEHMNGSSSPGVDGFTVNYLRVFWPDLKELTRDALNASVGNKLTQILNSAIFKLLRKGDKNPLLAESYRPISLLSIFYKLASCCITIRIKPVVELLIGMQQKAYIESNNIGSCILNILNLMEHANKKKLESLI